MGDKLHFKSIKVNLEDQMMNGGVQKSTFIVIDLNKQDAELLFFAV